MGGYSEPLVGVERGKKGWMIVALQQAMPILEWLPSYPLKEHLIPDLAASLTLGCVLVAQSIAHAALCNVKLIHGPYSCMLPPLIYAVFGTSVHASVGTGGLISLLTGEQLLHVGDLEERTRKGTMLTLLVGAVITLMGVFQLSFLVRFLSKPALSGFVTGSAVLIILSQLTPMFGLPKDEAKDGIVRVFLFHPEYLAHCAWPTLALGAAALVFLLNSKRLKGVKYLEYIAKFKELFLLIVTAAFCNRWNDGLDPEDRSRIPVIGAVPSGLPSFSFPVSSHEDLTVLKEMLPGATLIALVTFLSSFAAAKKFAMKDGYEVCASNELLALGLANAGGAFMGAVPVQIGLSRSTLAYQAGVKSQLGSNIFVAVIVASVIQVFSPYLYNVPRCVLNAIIVNAATHLQEVDQLMELWDFARDTKHNWKVRMEVVVWLSGFCCTLVFGAFMGMLVAVAISLVLIVNQVSNPDIHRLGHKADEKPPFRHWVAAGFHQELQFEAGILVFRLDGPLFYANVERLQEWLDEEELRMAGEGTACQAVVFNAAGVSFIDTTGLTAVLDLMKSYEERRTVFFIANRAGQTGRLLQEKVVPRLNAQLETELQERADACHSVDDFIKLIQDNSSTKTLRAKALMRVSQFVTRQDLDA